MSAVSSPAALPLYLTVKKAIEVFSISKPTIYRQIEAGNIRKTKVGRRSLIEVASVKEFLRASTVVQRRPHPGA